jgi:uncharacterized protein YjiS (DUF1127 family)
MTLILDHASSSRGSFLRVAQDVLHVVASAFRRIGALIAAEIDRRQTMQLLEFDAHALKDMGITHADVEGALLTPISRKPSLTLAARRSEARRAEREQAIEAMSAAHE